VPTAFSLNGTTVGGQRDDPAERHGERDDQRERDGGRGLHEHGDTEPAGNVTNLGSTTATAPGTVGVVVTPSLSKNRASTTIAVGGTTSFTIVIGNAGPSTLTTASIVDTLPANLTAYAVQSAVQGGASVPTAFSLNGTTYRAA
jgi:uncharacterized repeat protein (TIGR01451 family)